MCRQKKGRENGTPPVGTAYRNEGRQVGERGAWEEVRRAVLAVRQAAGVGAD